jgi:hypothetical protein
MASEDQIKVGNTSKSSVASEPPKETRSVRGPDIVLRTFQPSDLPYAKHIYYSTYFGQVPQGVKSKLLNPLTWALFFGSCKLSTVFVIGHCHSYSFRSIPQ